MIKLRGRFLIWTLGLLIIIVVTHFKLRAFSNVLIIFWLSLLIVDIVSIFLIRYLFKTSVRLSEEWIERDQHATWQVAIETRSFLSSIRGILAIDNHPEPFAVTRTQPYHQTISKTGRHTGLLSVPDIKAELESEFGFFGSPFLLHNLGHDALVLPKLSVPAEIQSVLTKHLDNHARNLQKMELVEEEFDYLDTLKPGEPLRHVHWKLSARQQRFIIIRHKPPVRPTTKVWVRLHKPTLDEKDRTLDIASFMIQKWHRKGYDISLNDEPVKTVLEARKSLAVLDETRSQLTLAQMTNYNGLMLITNDLNHDLIEYLASLQHRRGIISLVVLNDYDRKAVESLPNIQVLRVSDYV